MPKQATTPPFRHVDPTRTAEAFQFDDMSSINRSIVDVDEEESRRVRSERSHVDNSTAIRSGSNHSNPWEDHQRAVRRKNIFISLILLMSIGVVGAIAAAIVTVMQNSKSVGEEDREANLALSDESMDTNLTEGDTTFEIYENNTANVFETNTSSTIEENYEIELEPEANLLNETFASTVYPTTTATIPITKIPSISPTTICIPLELGIIEEDANMTEWEVIKDGVVDNEVVWQSSSYDIPAYNSMTFTTCLPPHIYKFRFNGARSYVLSSNGEVIVTGMSIDAIEDVVAFELPFQAPEFMDIDGDGLEDRLGTLMSYNSTRLQEGADCEPFRLYLVTDDLGVETVWRLYEGNNTGEMIANGGPYASNSYYLYEYCLKSPGIYTFYILDWASDGICCGKGEGYYMLSIGDETIVNATGVFDGADMTVFTLPTYISQMPSASSTPTMVPTKEPKQGNDDNKSQNEKLPTQITAPTIVPNKSSDNKPPKDN